MMFCACRRSSPCTAKRSDMPSIQGGIIGVWLLLSSFSNVVAGSDTQQRRSRCNPQAELCRGRHAPLVVVSGPEASNSQRSLLCWAPVRADLRKFCIGCQAAFIFVLIDGNIGFICRNHCKRLPKLSDRLSIEEVIFISKESPWRAVPCALTGRRDALSGEVLLSFSARVPVRECTVGPSPKTIVILRQRNRRARALIEKMPLRSLICPTH